MYGHTATTNGQLSTTLISTTIIINQQSWSIAIALHTFTSSINVRTINRHHQPSSKTSSVIVITTNHHHQHRHHHRPHHHYHQQKSQIIASVASGAAPISCQCTLRDIWSGRCEVTCKLQGFVFIWY